MSYYSRKQSEIQKEEISWMDFDIHNTITRDKNHQKFPDSYRLPHVDNFIVRPDARISSSDKTIKFCPMLINKYFNTDAYAEEQRYVMNRFNGRPIEDDYHAYKEEVKKREMAWRIKKQNQFPNLKMNFKIEII